ASIYNRERSSWGGDDVAAEKALGGSARREGYLERRICTITPDRLEVRTARGVSSRREVYLARRICTITPDRIEVRPARSIIFLPLFTLAIGLAAFPAIFFWGDWLSIGLRLLLTLGALIVVPVSGLGLVYSIAGANIVVDRAKQSIVLQQGYLGMGVGTLELVPFWKLDIML